MRKATTVRVKMKCGWKTLPLVLQEKNVSVGITVKWINKDDVYHTVTSSGGLFDSGHIAAGEIYEYTFDSAGTYDYVCTLHSGMTGTVIVGESENDGGDDNNGGGGDH